MQASASLSRRPNRPFLLVGALAIWIGLWILPWQPLLKSLPALAVLIAFAMYLVPGALLQQLVWSDRRFYPLRAITVGFALSVALTAALGLIAIVFHLSISFVLSSLFWIASVLFVILIGRGIRLTVNALPRSWVNAFLMATALVIMALAATLTFSNAGYNDTATDDSSYNAYTQAFAYSGHLGFGEVYFGTGAMSSARFWLSMWPMSQAVLVRVSDVHLLTLLPILKMYLIALSLACMYELARALGLSAPVAWLAIIGEIAWLYSPWSVGSYTMVDITQDKLMLAKVIAPVIFRLLAAVFQDRRYWKLFAAACLGAALTHSTSFALTAMVCGLYCLGEMLLFRHYRTAFTVIGVLAVCVGLLLPLRLAERRYVFQLADENSATDGILDQNDGNEDRLSRLNIVEGTPFYGLKFRPFNKMPQQMVFVSGLCALFFLRRSTAARFIASVLLLFLIELFPYTGWLIGVTITPYHLWRVYWLLPVGIGWAFLVSLAVALLSRLASAGSRAPWLKDAALAALGAASLVVVSTTWLRDNGVRVQLGRITHGQQPSTGYETLAQLGDLLDSELSAPSVIIANSVSLSSMIPGLSANAKTLIFRGNLLADRQTQMGLEVLTARAQDFRRFWHSERNETRLRILDEYGVQLVITDGSEPVMTQLADAYPDRMTRIAQIGEYQVFRYTPA